MLASRPARSAAICMSFFAETQRPEAPFWTEHAYQRLRQIKANVDAGDMIRSNHPIPPAR